MVFGNDYRIKYCEFIEFIHKASYNDLIYNCNVNYIPNITGLHRIQLIKK